MVMSAAKYAAVKELIQEHQYGVARAVLRTVNDPKSQLWLARLDEIDPQFKSQLESNQAPVESSYRKETEQQEYYRVENKYRRFRIIFNGLKLVALGIFCFGIYWFFSLPSPAGGAPKTVGIEALLIVLGIISIIGGIYRIIKQE
jgi:hypothetical protein